MLSTPFPYDVIMKIDQMENNTHRERKKKREREGVRIDHHATSYHTTSSTAVVRIVESDSHELCKLYDKNELQPSLSINLSKCKCFLLFIL